MTDAFAAPWDNPFVAGQTGAGQLNIGHTLPADQASVPVPSAAQHAPPEAGEGPDFTDQTEFGEPGLSESYIDQTPYQPPGVGPSVAWDAPPRVTNEIRGIDHGAPAFFNRWTPQDTGRMVTTDQTTASWSRGITTDNLGRLELENIGRPEHDISQVVIRDNSPHWIGYQERPLLGNIATPAPYIQSRDPSQYVPNAAYPDLARFQFGAETYQTPPDPPQAVPAPPQGYAAPGGYESQGEWDG